MVMERNWCRQGASVLCRSSLSHQQCGVERDHATRQCVSDFLHDESENNDARVTEFGSLDGMLLDP